MHQELINQLIEIRKRLIYVILGFIIVFIPLYHFANDIYNIMAKPLLNYLPQNTQLVAIDVVAPFFVPLKLTALTAFFISLPNTVFQIWYYIAPALYKKEKTIILYLTLTVIILFILGILFCYFLALPILFGFISHIKTDDILMMADIGKYLDLILTLFMVFGLSFQMPIIIFLLIRLGLVNINKMKAARAYFLVGAFIIAAIVTPPDIFSQTMLAIPLYLLYEIGMLIGRFSIRK